MNILLINHYAGSTAHGMEYRPYYMAREWTRMGHRVTIIAASFSHVRSVQPTVEKSVTEEVMDGITYLWLRAPSYIGNGFARIRNMLTFVFQLLLQSRDLANSLKPDIVIASSTYPLDIYPAKRIAKLSGAKLIFEVHDLWPLSPMELNNMSRWHPFIMAMQKAENDAYRCADKVVSMLPNTLDHMTQHGMRKDKFEYIPNGIVADEWRGRAEPMPEGHSEVIERLRGNERFLVGYAGAHGIANALDSLMDAAQLVSGKAEIVLVGAGPEKLRLQNVVTSRKIDNVTFLDPINKFAVPSFLAQMDGLYIGLQKQSLFRFGVSPNKLMDYMMARRPVIYAIDAGSNLVDASDCGVSIEPESPEATADAISQMMALPLETRKTMGDNGRAYVLAHHEYNVLAKKFCDLMQRR